jgi:DNA-binding NtrC family response regulator
MDGSTTTRRVMIVDDESVVLATLERLISSWGYTSLPFGTFEAARAFLEHDTPDALIVDIRLGAFNGLQLVHLAHQRRPDLVVVAMSGFDDPVLRREAEQAGASFVVKPFVAEALRRALDG